MPCGRDQLAAKAVAALQGKRVVLVSGGWRHTVAADETGQTFSWGWNKARSPGPLKRQARLDALITTTDRDMVLFLGDQA